MSTQVSGSEGGRGLAVYGDTKREVMVFGTCLDEDDQDTQQTLPRFSHDMSETSKDTARNFRNVYRQVSCFVLYGGDTNPPPPPQLNNKTGKMLRLHAW